jgi:hypothetical protein
MRICIQGSVLALRYWCRYIYMRVCVCVCMCVCVLLVPQTAVLAHIYHTTTSAHTHVGVWHTHTHTHTRRTASLRSTLYLPQNTSSTYKAVGKKKNTDSFLALRALVAAGRSTAGDPRRRIVLLTTFDVESRFIAHQEVSTISNAYYIYMDIYIYMEIYHIFTHIEALLYIYSHWTLKAVSSPIRRCPSHRTLSVYIYIPIYIYIYSYLLYIYIYRSLIIYIFTFDAESRFIAHQEVSII